MDLQPRFEHLPEKKLIGQRRTMSLVDNQTRALWQNFMPRRRELANAVAAEFYSIEIYPDDYFRSFVPAREFEKWAAVEVADFSVVPDEMETLVIPAGFYAVFTHRGDLAQGIETYRHIYGTWLPHSGFALDARPHFALMGEKYRGDDAGSEEEFWIPLKADSAV